MGRHGITIVTEAVIVAILLAGRSLDDHVRAVAIAWDAAQAVILMLHGRLSQ